MKNPKRADRKCTGRWCANRNFLHLTAFWFCRWGQAHTLSVRACQNCSQGHRGMPILPYSWSHYSTSCIWFVFWKPWPWAVDSCESSINLLQWGNNEGKWALQVGTAVARAFLFGGSKSSELAAKWVIRCARAHRCSFILIARCSFKTAIFHRAAARTYRNKRPSAMTRCWGHTKETIKLETEPSKKHRDGFKCFRSSHSVHI